MPDLIIGTHSIVEAIKNKKRINKRLFGTKEMVNKLFGQYKFEDKVEKNIVSPEEIQNLIQGYCRKYDFQPFKLPTKLFLEADSLGETHVGDLYDQLKDKPLKLLAVDGVTDVHNFAAILRSAAFYGVDAVIYSQREKRFPPSFFRIASGASEHVKLVNLTSLPKGLAQLQKRDIICLGLSEHSEEVAVDGLQDKTICLVVGSEEKGISFATQRVLDHCIAIESVGAIKSLNVSVASAIAMERFFNR